MPDFGGSDPPVGRAAPYAVHVECDVGRFNLRSGRHRCGGGGARAGVTCKGKRTWLVLLEGWRRWLRIWQWSIANLDSLVYDAQESGYSAATTWRRVLPPDPEVS